MNFSDAASCFVVNEKRPVEMGKEKLSLFLMSSAYFICALAVSYIFSQMGFVAYDAFSISALLAVLVVPALYFVVVRPVAHHFTDYAEVREELSRSVERNNHIMSAISDIYWEIDSDLKYSLVSGNAEKVFGYEAEELVGRSFFEFIPKHNVEGIRGKLDNLAFGVASAGELEMWVSRKNGTMVCLWASAVPMKDERGRLVGYRGVLRDITDRKNSEEALRVSETKYKIIADNNYDWEFWLNPQGGVIYSSPSCERITGHEAEEFESNSDLFRNLVHPDDQPVFVDSMNRFIEKEKTGSVRFRVISRSGEERMIACYCMPVYDNEGQYLGVRGTNRDVTTRFLVEKKLRESERRFREIIENIHLAAFIMDMDGFVFYSNNFLLNTCGYEQKEVVGRSFFEKFIDDKEADKLQRFLLDDARHGKAPRHFVCNIRTKAGEQKKISWNNTVLHNADGEVIGITCIGEDITGREEMYAASMTFGGGYT